MFIGKSVIDGIGVGVVLALTTIFTPLLQTSFLPEEIQVYFLLSEILICPFVVHLPPANTAAFAGSDINEALIAAAKRNAMILFILK